MIITILLLIYIYQIVMMIIVVDTCMTKIIVP